MPRTYSIAAALMLFSAVPALADRIDGEWCNANRAIVVNGPSITTPAGTVVQGQYDRHDFTYTVPANEPGAGQQVEGRLLNEENAQVRFGAGQPEVWRRCKVTS
jgi:hypothetical protein